MTQQNKEGMRYPSIDQLSNKTSSKYKLVIAASKRAKEIDATHKTYLGETKNTKSIGIVIKYDKISILFSGNKIIL